MPARPGSRQQGGTVSGLTVSLLPVSERPLGPDDEVGEAERQKPTLSDAGSSLYVL